MLTVAIFLLFVFKYLQSRYKTTNLGQVRKKIKESSTYCEQNSSYA